jgi:glycine C-acetyltransferase
VNQPLLRLGDFEGPPPPPARRSLLDFYRATGDGLEARAAQLTELYREALDQGLLPFGREVASAAGPRVKLRDPRTGALREELMLGSANALGLAGHPRVKARALAALEQFGAGVGGPPHLAGTTSLHRALERALAELAAQEEAVLFSSGFQANLGWLSALLRPEDTLLHDELSHPSTVDGLILARAGRPRTRDLAFRHHDLDHLERRLAEAARTRPRHGLLFVAVEGVCPLDGGLAPLEAMVGLCQRHRATLVVDDAHGLGVLGDTGGGTAEHLGVASQVDLTVGTLGKALGASGGFLAASAEVADLLRCSARGHLLSTALPPAAVAAALGSLEVLRDEPQRRQALHANVQYLCAGLTRRGFPAATRSAIIPVQVPARLELRRLGRRFPELGVFLDTVEPPAVPAGEQRLRLTPMATHTRADLDQVLEAFSTVARELGW